MIRGVWVIVASGLSLVVMPAQEMSDKAEVSDKAETLTRERASAFAQLALRAVQKEYPNKLGHVLLNANDAKTPKALHPAFYGCYDWHSAVHGHWMLVRVLRTYPDLPEAEQIRTVLNEHLTAENIRAEVAYFQRPEAQSFERPYGWSWLLKLAEELSTWDDKQAQKWFANVRPLAELIAKRYQDYFPKQTYPIRAGVHSNTAFGLTFAYDYAKTTGHKKLQELIEERAKTYFGHDTDAPARWEPDGADFLSPSLCEADLMRRVLPANEFREWFHKYLPGAAKGEPATLFTPATVTDRRDPQLVHLDGLNLSRAWCLRGILTALPPDDPARAALTAAAVRHAQAGLKHVASGDYAGEHWLASFAVWMLSVPAPK
ncbi:MAG: DUF2891 domain-containing protein [Gemmataceae bacterium]|nr:DUF2891 domain-containing protein [Gemmata sp.]MDW8198377.1 DUF2891 domain-containing protein [Gemmataceae bacterium]